MGDGRRLVSLIEDLRQEAAIVIGYGELVSESAVSPLFYKRAYRSSHRMVGLLDEIEKLALQSKSE